MPDKKLHIIFYYPSRIVGGTEHLFYRMAETLASQGIMTSYIDYADGYIAGRIRDTDIGLLAVSETDMLQIPDHAVIVMPPSLAFDGVIGRLALNATHRIVFWCLHFHNYLHMLPKNHLYINQDVRCIKKLLWLLFPSLIQAIRQVSDHAIRHRAFAFIDNFNYEYNQYIFGFQVYEPVILSTTVEIDTTQHTSTRPAHSDRDSHLYLSWIGRLSIEKMYPLLHTLIGLADHAKNHHKKIRIDIIGEGEHKNTLKDKVRDYKLTDHLDINWLGTMQANQLQEYLTTQPIDIGIGLGTSVLEFAKYKIPCLKLIQSYKEINQQTPILKWLYDSIALGDEYLDPTKDKAERKTIVQILDSYQPDSGEKCYQHLLDNWELQKISRDFLGYIDESSWYYDPSTLTPLYTEIKKKHYLPRIIIKIIYALQKMLRLKVCQ